MPRLWRLKRQQTAVYLAKNHGVLSSYIRPRQPTAMQMIESLWLQPAAVNLALSEFGLKVGQDHHRVCRRAGETRRKGPHGDPGRISDAATISSKFLQSRDNSATKATPRVISRLHCEENMLEGTGCHRHGPARGIGQAYAQSACRHGSKTSHRHQPCDETLAAINPRGGCHRAQLDRVDM